MIRKNSQLLRNALMGDVDAICELRKVSHSDLTECARDVGKLIITKAAVIRALIALKEGVSSPSDVQAWASFIRRGYISSNSTMPITPLAIMSSPLDDEAIADVISRLDEIGDMVDGILENDEISRLVDSLEHA